MNRAKSVWVQLKALTLDWAADTRLTFTIFVLDTSIGINPFRCCQFLVNSDSGYLYISKWQHLLRDQAGYLVSNVQQNWVRFFRFMSNWAKPWISSGQRHEILPGSASLIFRPMSSGQNGPHVTPFRREPTLNRMVVAWEREREREA